RRVVGKLDRVSDSVESARRQVFECVIIGGPGVTRKPGDGWRCVGGEKVALGEGKYVVASFSCTKKHCVAVLVESKLVFSAISVALVDSSPSHVLEKLSFLTQSVLC